MYRDIFVLLFICLYPAVRTTLLVYHVTLLVHRGLFPQSDEINGIHLQENWIFSQFISTVL